MANIDIYHSNRDYLDTLSGNAIIKAIADTSYQLALTDKECILTFSNSSPVAVTIPTYALVPFPVGSRIDLIQNGTGKVTLGGSGVTIKSKAGNKSIAAQYVAVSLVKELTDTWFLIGELIA